MSNNKTHRSTKLIQYAFGMLLLLGAGQAFAAAAGGTAANHIIENTVDLSYESTSGTTFTDTTFAQVTVDTIQIAPSVVYKDTYLTVEGDGTDITDLAEDTLYTVIYTLTSNSNGPEKYSLSGSAALTQTNLDASAVFGTVSDFTLGASSVANVAQFSLDTSSATANINVPSDGNANNGDSLGLNGLFIGTTIVVNTTTGDDAVCTITAVDDGTGGTGNAIGSITVDECFADGDGAEAEVAFTVDPGDPIVERAEILISVTTDSVTATFVFGTHDDINVTTDTSTVSSAGAATGSPEVAVDQIFTVYDNNLNIYKFVRNATVATSGLTPTVEYDALQVADSDVGALNTATFYRSGGDDKSGEITTNGLGGEVVALPGHVLEYAILIVNDGGTAANVVLTDNQALTLFTNIDETSPATSGILLMDAGIVTNCASFTCLITQKASTGATTAPTTLSHNDAAGDFGGLNGDVLTIYAGTAGDETATAGTEGGTIAIGESSLVVYRVTVD